MNINPVAVKAGPTKPKIAVVGSLIMDLVVEVERAPEEGETVIGRGFGRYPGGKGANQAVAAARLGAEAHMIGRVGDDLFGHDQLESLGRAGVHTSTIIMDPAHPSGVAAIILDAAGRNRIAIVPGANHQVSAADVEAAKGVIGAADFLLVQFELPLSITMKAMALAAEVGTPVILNPAPAQPAGKEFFAKATLVTPNEVEAEQLTGIPVKDAAGAEKAARYMLEMGAKAAVITLGERGCFIMSPPGSPFGEQPAELIPAYKVKAVDTVAAGDAFNGALAVELARGASLKEAARFANATAAISVTRRGAQPAMPTREEVLAFMEENK